LKRRVKPRKRKRLYRAKKKKEVLSEKILLRKEKVSSAEGKKKAKNKSVGLRYQRKNTNRER